MFCVCSTKFTHIKHEQCGLDVARWRRRWWNVARQNIFPKDELYIGDGHNLAKNFAQLCFSLPDIILWHGTKAGNVHSRRA